MAMPAKHEHILCDDQGEPFRLWCGKCRKYQPIEDFGRRANVPHRLDREYLCRKSAAKRDSGAEPERRPPNIAAINVLTLWPAVRVGGRND
jgi:hypothetical protein